MPIDTKASYYQWFMAEDPTQRIVGYEWHPEAGVIFSSMTPGRLVFMARDEPGDTWGPPRTVVEEIPWAVAQNFARKEGCDVEVAVTNDTREGQ